MSMISSLFHHTPRVAPANPTSLEESYERLGKVQSWLKSEGIDGAIFTNNKNIRYLTRFAPAGADPEEAFLVVTPNKVMLFTTGFYEAKARRDAPHIPLEVATREGAAAALPKFFTDIIGAGAKKVAVEKNDMMAARQDMLQDLFPDAKLVGMKVTESLRESKTPEEVAELRKAIAATQTAMREVARSAKPGATEKSLAEVFQHSLLKQGAGEAFFTIMAAGPDGAEPHFDEPTDRPLKRGEMIVMDVGAKVGDYNADMTRMIVLGKPSPEAQKVLNLVRDAQAAAIAKVAPGVPAREIDQAARDVIAKAGYGDRFIHGVGHGVGMDVHENPRLTPSTSPSVLLKKGNVVTAEPGVYLPGKFGVRMEDMILVTEKGHENLSGDLQKVFYAGGILDKMKSAWDSITRRFHHSSN